MYTVNSNLLQALNAKLWDLTSEELASKWSDIIIRTFRNVMDYLWSLKSYTTVTKIRSTLHLPASKWNIWITTTIQKDSFAEFIVFIATETHKHRVICFDVVPRRRFTTTQLLVTWGVTWVETAEVSHYIMLKRKWLIDEIFRKLFSEPQYCGL